MSQEPAAAAANPLEVEKAPYDRTKIVSLPDLKLNESNDDFPNVRGYLQSYGYLKPTEGSTADPATLDEEASNAIKLFQTFTQLPQSGELDSATRKELGSDRCGVVDPPVDPLAFEVRNPWHKRSLSYKVSKASAQPQLTEAVCKAAIRRAFRTWSQAGVGLSFTEVEDLTEDADIVVEWRPAADPDHNMVGGTIAHADFPKRPLVSRGVAQAVGPTLPVHFDDVEHNWADGAVVGAHDIETVAVHEIGHCLGMMHSTVRGSVMYFAIATNTTKRRLTADDLEGINTLYPPPSPVVVAEDEQKADGEKLP